MISPATTCAANAHPKPLRTIDARTRTVPEDHPPARHRPWATNLIFAPGYQDRIAPFGTWSARRLFTTKLWRKKARFSGDVGAAAQGGEQKTHTFFVAFAHGFVSMELAGAFRLGGDVDRAWRTGVATIVDAVADIRPR